MPSRGLGILLAFLLCAQVRAEEDLLSPASGIDASSGALTEPPPDRTDSPARPADPPAEVQKFLRQGRADFTWLSGGGGRTLEMEDVEATATFAVPVVDGWAPLLLTPYAAVRFWQPPKGGSVPDLPANLYDLNVELGWRPRLARWLFADLALTPGVYTDFKTSDSDMFQLRGRGVGIVAFSEQFQVALGGMYVNRNKTKFLPAGGIIWSPDEDTRFFLVFPAPKITRRLGNAAGLQWSTYVAGEFGGGRWIVQRASGASDSLDYTDLRANLGLEALTSWGVKGHVEVGYVFARRVNFVSATPDYKPQDAVMLRTGLSY